MGRATSKTDVFFSDNPWEHNGNEIWLASSLKFYRNLERFQFPPKLSEEQRLQILSVVREELLSCQDLKNPRLFNGEELGPLGKEYFLELFLLTEGLHHAGAAEGFLADETGTFLAIINIRNHLQLQLMDYDSNIEKTLNKLIKIESFLQKSLGFAFSERFGFLSADPSRCGTALLVSAYLHVPALIHLQKLDSLRQQCEEADLQILSMHGDPENLLGDILCLRNTQTIGLNEEQIISSIRSWATKLMLEEQGARKEILEKGNDPIKDLVSRAFGMLTTSYILETSETLDALSLVKFGVELGWIEGVDAQTLNRLFFGSRRAHLTVMLDGQKKEEEEQRDLLRARAEYVHRALAESKLVL